VGFPTLVWLKPRPRAPKMLVPQEKAWPEDVTAIVWVLLQIISVTRFKNGYSLPSLHIDGRRSSISVGCLTSLFSLRYGIPIF